MAPKFAQPPAGAVVAAAADAAARRRQRDGTARAGEERADGRHVADRADDEGLQRSEDEVPKAIADANALFVKAPH